MNEQAHRHASGDESSADRQSVDPVCGMRVDDKTPHRYTFERREFLFCSARCRKRFMAAPTQYVKKADTETPSETARPSTHDHAQHVKTSEASGTPKRVEALPARAGTQEAAGAVTMYTCPMHPQTRRPA